MNSRVISGFQKIFIRVKLLFAKIFPPIKKILTKIKLTKQFQLSEVLKSPLTKQKNGKLKFLSANIYSKGEWGIKIN